MQRQREIDRTIQEIRQSERGNDEEGRADNVIKRYVHKAGLSPICCQVRNFNWILLNINQMKSNKSQSTLCQSQKKENLNREHGTSVIRHQVPNSNIFSSQPYPLSSRPRDTRSNSLLQSLLMPSQSQKVEKALTFS